MTYELLFCDMTWLRKHPNGSIGGIIGKVAQREADVGITWISWTQERVELVDFGLSHFQVPVTFTTSRPRPILPLTLLIEPFSWDIWCTTLVLYILSLLIVPLIRGKSPSGDYIWLVTAWHLRNSWPIGQLAKGTPLRTFLHFLIMYLLFLTCIYGQRLLDLITESDFRGNIDTVDELLAGAQSGKVTVKVVNGSSFLVNLRESPDWRLQRLANLAHPYPKVEWPPDQFMERAAHGINQPILAYLTPAMVIDCNLRARRPDLYYGPTELDVIGPATLYMDKLSLVYPKGDSRWRSRIDPLIFRLMMNALFTRWYTLARIDAIAHYRDQARLATNPKSKEEEDDCGSREHSRTLHSSRIKMRHLSSLVSAMLLAQITAGLMVLGERAYDKGRSLLHLRCLRKRRRRRGRLVNQASLQSDVMPFVEC